MEKKILKELDIARKNLQSSGKNTDDVDLLILSLLKVINSGRVRGIFSVRINGHTITNPKLEDLKISLEELKVLLNEKELIILF